MRHDMRNTWVPLGQPTPGYICHRSQAPPLPPPILSHCQCRVLRAVFVDFLSLTLRREKEGEEGVPDNARNKHCTSRIVTKRAGGNCLGESLGGKLGVGPVGVALIILNYI